MSLNVKLVFGLILIVSLVSIVMLGDFLHRVSARLPTPFSDNIIALLPPGDDRDQDGLTDAEEARWETDASNPDTDGDGFLDGEEVISGHNPRVAGPDDVIEFSLKPQNITQRMGELVAAGMYEGSLDSDNENFDESMELLTNDLVYQARVNLGENTPNTFFSVPTTDDNVQTYIRSIAPVARVVAEEFPWGILRMKEAADATSIDGGKAWQEFFGKEIALIDSQIIILENMQVPTQYASLHSGFMTFLKNIKRFYAMLGNSQGDSMQEMIAFESILDLVTNQIFDELQAFNVLPAESITSE